VGWGQSEKSGAANIIPAKAETRIMPRRFSTPRFLRHSRASGNLFAIRKNIL